MKKNIIIFTFLLLIGCESNYIDAVVVDRKSGEYPYLINKDDNYLIKPAKKRFWLRISISKQESPYPSYKWIEVQEKQFKDCPIGTKFISSKPPY